MLELKNLARTPFHIMFILDMLDRHGEPMLVISEEVMKMSRNITICLLRTKETTKEIINTMAPRLVDETKPQ